MRLSTEHDFTLGVWRIRPSLGSVETKIGAERLEPQVMRVLITLARHAGDTVDRDRLIDEAWNGRAVTDDAIGRCVSQLRRLIDEDTGSDLKIETIPKIGYRLVIGSETAPAEMGEPVQHTTGWPMWGLVAGLTLTIIVLVGKFSFSPPTTTRDISTRPLTSEPGLEVSAALSPAGGAVAYAKQTPAGGWDLFLRAIGADAPVRLTNHPARDYAPAWSPDGAGILFARSNPDRCSLHTVAATGGSERFVGDCAAAGVLSLDWSPDGTSVAIVERGTGYSTQGRLYNPKTGESRAVVAPTEARLGVEDMRFSPDGTRIAFTAVYGLGAEDLYVRHLETGETNRRTFDHLKIHGLDWTPDGKSVLVSSNRSGPFQLWRVPAKRGKISPLPVPFQSADGISIAQSGRVIAEEWRERAQLVRLDPSSGGLTPALGLRSTRFEWGADVSPDGTRLAFVSDRSGTAEIWVADPDGSDPKKLTDFGGAYVQTPRWSPGGERIVFAAPAEGPFDLYTVDPNTAEVIRLTHAEGQHLMPTWTPDGSNIVTASDRDGQWALWRLQPDTGIHEKLGFEGARFGRLLGRHMYFVLWDEAGLWRTELESDDRELVVPELNPVDAENWLIVDKKLYNIRRVYSEPPVLMRLDMTDGRVQPVAAVHGFLFKSGLTFDPGSGDLFLSRIVEEEADIYVVDGLFGARP